MPKDDRKDDAENRRDMAREIIESVGGSLHGFWYAFGQYDGYTLWERLSGAPNLSPAVARPEATKPSVPSAGFEYPTWKGRWCLRRFKKIVN